MTMNQLGRLSRYAAVLAGCILMATTTLAASDRGGQFTKTFSQVLSMHVSTQLCR